MLSIKYEALSKKKSPHKVQVCEQPNKQKGELDEPVHPNSLVRIFAARYIHSWFPLLYREIKKQHITKTCLYNFDPLKPHFYIVKLGFTGVDIIFLISAQSIDCGYSLEPPRRGGSNEYTQSIF